MAKAHECRSCGKLFKDYMFEEVFETHDHLDVDWCRLHPKTLVITGKYGGGSALCPECLAKHMATMLALLHFKLHGEEVLYPEVTVSIPCKKCKAQHEPSKIPDMKKTHNSESPFKKNGFTMKYDWNAYKWYVNGCPDCKGRKTNGRKKKTRKKVRK